MTGRLTALPDVALLPFRREDAPTMARWLADPRVLAAAAPGWPHPVSATHILREYFEDGSPAEHFRAALDGVTIGHAALRATAEASGHLYHILVDPLLHGRGFGGALMRAVCRLAFDERGLHRLTLYVFDDNAAAIACYLRAGFRIEGHHRDTYRQGDRWLSTYSMALLRPEWEERRRAAG